MVLKVQTEEGWVYFDDVQKLEVVRILYRMKPAEYGKGHARGVCPEFSDTGDGGALIYPSDAYIVTHVFPEGKPQQNDGLWFRCCAARWPQKDGLRTVIFNGTGYLLNDNGKNIDSYRSN